MTRDALTAEGFGRAGANVGMVNNWFVDYCSNEGNNTKTFFDETPIC